MRKKNIPGVNLSVDSPPAVRQQPHMLTVFAQHHVTPVERPAHLAVPMGRLVQLCLHGGQDILLLIQFCFNVLHIDNTQETQVKCDQLSACF